MDREHDPILICEMDGDAGQLQFVAGFLLILRKPNGNESLISSHNREGRRA